MPFRIFRFKNFKICLLIIQNFKSQKSDHLLYNPGFSKTYPIYLAPIMLPVNIRSTSGALIGLFNKFIPNSCPENFKIFENFLIAVSKKASGATKQENMTALISKIGHL